MASTVTGISAGVAEVFHESQVKCALLAATGIMYAVVGYKVCKHNLPASGKYTGDVLK